MATYRQNSGNGTRTSQKKNQTDFFHAVGVYFVSALITLIVLAGLGYINISISFTPF